MKKPSKRYTSYPLTANVVGDGRTSSAAAAGGGARGSRSPRTSPDDDRNIDARQRQQVIIINAKITVTSESTANSTDSRAEFQRTPADRYLPGGMTGSSTVGA